MKSNRPLNRDEVEQLDLQARIDLEMQLKDAEADRVTQQSAPDSSQLDSYFNCSPWRKKMFSFLDPIAGRTVLDIGCGYNPTPILFALAGAKYVIACDVSPKALAHIDAMAKDSGVEQQVSVVLCAAEQLPLADETFDIVHGDGVLHHLLLPLAGAEITRVFTKDGKAAFKDPLGENPFLEFAREYVPYSWKGSVKGTDQPLLFRSIREFGNYFSTFTYQGFGFISMLPTLIWGRGRSKPTEIAYKLDDTILRLLPFLQRYCRFVVICVKK